MATFGGIAFPIICANKAFEIVVSKIKHLKDDKLQLIYSHHTDRIKKIISMIPKDGGSRKDLPYEYWLECHKKKNVGFSDVYGRMSWEKPAPTITGGCLSPSKGRFLHPDKNRSISAREAALLQSFPSDYIFDFPIASLTVFISSDSFSGRFTL